MSRFAADRRSDRVAKWDATQVDDVFEVEMAPDLARAVRDAVAAGDYASPQEALNDAVRVWSRERDEHAATLASIKERIRRSIEDPRPSLSSEEVREAIASMHAEALAARRREAP